MNNKNYMTQEQQDIIDQLNELYRDIYSPGYKRYNIESTISVLKKSDDEETLEERVKKAEEDGVANTKDAYRDTEWRIKRSTEDIEHLERELAKARKELEKAQKEKELLEKLEATNFQDILSQLKEDRRQELNNIEYEHIYKVFKGKEYLSQYRWDTSHRIVIRGEVWMVEKGNPSNKTKLYQAFQLDWKDRSQLVDELKKAGATKIVIDPKILTKKLEKEFEIAGTSESTWTLY